MSRPRIAESVFRAIADPKRRRVIDLLRAGDRTVGDLQESLRMSRTSMSYHMGVLMEAGLVRQRREGVFLRCSANSEPLLAAQAWLARNIKASGKAVAAER